MDLIAQYQDMICSIAHKYAYLGYEDVYNECVMYILEAIQEGKNPKRYMRAKIKKYIEKEQKFRDHYHYGV